MESTVVVVGAFARIRPSSHAQVKRELDAREGITTFDLETEDKLGLVVEADSLDSAHARITKDVRGTAGVLGVWPVSVEVDSDDPSGIDTFPEPTVVDEESDE